MLVLYTYWRSSAAYRVRIALNLKGLAWEPRFVHLARDEQNSAEYLAVNPQGRVPTLVHEGHTIPQSLAIIEYLDERFPDKPLLPRDVGARARVRSHAQYICSELQPLQNLAPGLYLKDVLNCTDDQVAAWRQHWASRGFEALEQLLSKNAGKFCEGDEPTMADCLLVAQCFSARRFGVDTSKYSTITRIDDLCQSLADFKRAHPDEQPDKA